MEFSTHRLSFAFITSLVFGMQLIASGAVAQNNSPTRIEHLIDELTQISAPAPGLNPYDTYDGFIVSDVPMRFEGGVLPVSEPVVLPQMRELVGLGRAALPLLLKHLTDKRSTKLVIKNPSMIETVGGMVLSDEYDPRYGPARRPHPDDLDRKAMDSYTVRVGDVCYVLIGQIVNRNLLAVRYQPSDIVYVNSPVQSPKLVEEARRDWDNLSPYDEQQQLLADLRAKNELWEFAGALERLRFYFPSAYAGLQGRDMDKRLEFEKREASQTK